MAGIFDTIGVDTSSSDLNEAVKISTGGVLAPKVYDFQIDRAYVTKTSGGANKLCIDFQYVKDDGDTGVFYYTNFISSGDEKGNKTTYTKDGKEHSLPGLIEFNNILKALKVENPDVKKATIELFDEPTEVLAMPTLSDKKCKAGIRTKYDDYREKDVAFVDTFLDSDGKNSDGEDLLEALEQKIEKTPYKKSRAKKAATNTNPASTGNSAVVAGSGWA